MYQKKKKKKLKCVADSDIADSNWMTNKWLRT